MDYLSDMRSPHSGYALLAAHKKTAPEENRDRCRWRGGLRQDWQTRHLGSLLADM